MGKGSRKGQKGGKGGKRDERLVRTPELDDRFNATPASTATNATFYFLSVSFYAEYSCASEGIFE